MKRTILLWLCSAVSLLAGTPWPHVDYKEVRAYAWKLHRPWEYPYEALIRMNFGMLSTGAGVVGAPLPAIQYSGMEIADWMRPFAQPFAHGWLIRPDMTFAHGVINKDGALLSAKQISRLLRAESRRFQPRAVAGCYSPHNAFVFYDAEKQPVAFLEICFDCMGARASPEDPGFDPDYYALAVLCAELKLPIGIEHTTAKQVRDSPEYWFDPLKGLPSHTTWRPPPWIRNLQGGQPQPGFPLP